MASQLRIPQRTATARPRAGTHPSTDPFAQQTPQQIQQVISGFLSRLPKPMSTAQIQTQAQGMLDPVIQRITDAINQKAAGQANAVTGYTNTLAANLAKMAPTFAAPYQQAEAATAASNQALADRLAGTGASVGADLSSRLASINAPGALDPAVAAANAAGGGAGNSLFASGNAALQQLAANAANAGSYGAKLPGIARLGGIQQAGLVRQQATSDLASKIAEAESQLPSIVGNLRTLSENRAGDRTNLAVDLYKTLTGQNITRATAQAGLIGDQASQALDAQKAAQQSAYDNARLQLTQQTANQRAAQAAQRAAQQQQNIALREASLTGVYNGQPTLQAKKATASAKKATKKSVPRLTAGQVQKYRGTAETIAQNALNGFDTTDKTGATQHHPPITYAQAVVEMRKEGIPDQIAKAILDRVYRNTMGPQPPLGSIG